MKKSVLLLALAAMVLLVFAAFAWDSVRRVDQTRRRMETADSDMRRNEQRLIKLLSGTPDVGLKVQSAIEAYEAASDIPTRHDAYDELVARFRQVGPSEIDATNPLDRKFMDDIAGAMNRREVSQKEYEIERAAYRKSLDGFRGRLARIFSSKSREDWSDSD